MRKLVLILLIACTTQAYAQTDGYADKFCEIMAAQKLLSAKVTLYVDSGQVTKLMTDTRVKEGGKNKEFYGVVGAMNYMSAHGWTFLNAFPVASGNSTVYHFFFKKRVPVSEIPKPVGETEND